MQVTDVEKFAKNLRFAYENDRMTQKQVADRAGITEAQLSRILNLQVPNVSMRVCSQLATAIGLVLADLTVEPREFMRNYGQRQMAESA